MCAKLYTRRWPLIGSQWRERAWLDVVATIVCALGLAVVMGALLANFYYYISYGLGAIGYPYELDYGEGLVWQQMADLPNGRMYTSIHDYPYMVYTYTPLYHTVAYIAAMLLGDPLFAGRAVSMASALLLAAFVGFAVVQASGRSYPSSARLIGAVIAALLLFTFRQVSFWSVLMRVDMLAIMLSVLGFNLFLASLRKPWLMYPCGLAYVLALLAKQNTIAGAVACCGVSLMVRPALTLRAIALSATLGGAAVARRVRAGGIDGERVAPRRFCWLCSCSGQWAFLSKLGAANRRCHSCAAAFHFPASLFLVGPYARRHAGHHAECTRIQPVSRIPQKALAHVPVWACLRACLTCQTEHHRRGSRLLRGFANGSTRTHPARDCVIGHPGGAPRWRSLPSSPMVSSSGMSFSTI